MKEPVEIPSQFSTLTEWCEDLARQGLTPREIRQKTNCSKSTAYNSVKKIDKEKAQGKAEPSEVKVHEVQKEVAEIKEPPKVEEPEPAEPLDKIAGKLIAGAILDPEDLEYLFRALNDLFPNQFQRPDKSMKLLGKVWFKPANRILQDYMEQNIDVYFAGIVTVIVFAPAIYGTLKQLTGKKTRKKEKKEEE